MSLRQIVLANALLCAFATAAPAADSDRPDHYEGKPAPTLEAAWANMAAANPALAAILDRAELRPEDHAQIHQLTYTLEVALQRIEAELRATQATLEELHLASEQFDTPTVRRTGKIYLDQAGKLPPAP